MYQGSVTNTPSVTDGAENGPSTSAPSPVSGDATKADEEAPAGDAEVGAEEAVPTPMDVEKAKPEDESKNQTPVPINQPTPRQQTQKQPQQRQGPGSVPRQTSKEAAPQIDLFLEASKLPLDVAVFNSTRAAGGDDKIRKYLQAILVVGGVAMTSGVQFALESRYVRLSFQFYLCGGARRGDKVLACPSRASPVFDWPWLGIILMIGTVFFFLLVGCKRLPRRLYKTWKGSKRLCLRWKSMSRLSPGEGRLCWDVWRARPICG